MNFSDLNIENKLKRSIELAEFKIPTPIQSQSIPISLEGKDVLGTAQTGTGKTIALLQSAWASYKEQSKRNLIWFHAVSIGELMSIIPIINRLEKNRL